MRAALAEHDAALRKALEAHDGLVFKHTGDGICAAFSSPKSAVDAAITAQRTLKLPVRMGLVSAPGLKSEQVVPEQAAQDSTETDSWRPARPNCVRVITSVRCLNALRGSWRPGMAVRSCWPSRRRC